MSQNSHASGVPEASPHLIQGHRSDWQPKARYLIHIADDQLVMGHRNSEWTGLGPILEEDIAFSSIAQDQVGHAQAFYEILHREMGFPDPDQFAFNRPAALFCSSWLCEQPIGDYAFSLVRHWCYDRSVRIRYEALSRSEDSVLRPMALKLLGEVKYHVFHADTWMKSLLQGSEESRLRVIAALKSCWPMALGLFEPWQGESEAAAQGLYPGEKPLLEIWKHASYQDLQSWGVEVDRLGLEQVDPVLGGRQGYHSEHLEAMLDEMTAVFRLDPGAEW